ncbi:hypothetical protein CVS40_10467 [Lucilia cuprina]|nr:hypothetical protein CVS40_10467 [Lucilia cuprina]
MTTILKAEKISDNIEFQIRVRLMVPEKATLATLICTFHFDKQNDIIPLVSTKNDEQTNNKLKSFLQASEKGGGVTNKKKHKNEQQAKKETTNEQISTKEKTDLRIIHHPASSLPVSAKSICSGNLVRRCLKKKSVVIVATQQHYLHLFVINKDANIRIKSNSLEGKFIISSKINKTNCVHIKTFTGLRSLSHEMVNASPLSAKEANA